MNKIFAPKTLWWSLGFIGISLLASQIQFTPFVIGRLNFSLFDLYAPVAGAWFGMFGGGFVVVVVGLLNLALHHSATAAALAHLIPVLFGTWYFASPKRRLINYLPLLAIAAFLINPVSRPAWAYSLFWLIPILCAPLKKQSPMARALGASFTSHAIGGLIWLYLFNPPAALWAGLVPVVLAERLIMSVTLAGVYMMVEKIKALVPHAIYQS